MLELILRILDFSLSILKPILVDVTLITVVHFESAAGCEKAALGHLKIPAHPIVSKIFLWIPFLFWAVVFFNSVNGKQIQVRERKLFPMVGAVAEVSFIVSAEIHSLCWCFLYSTTSSHVVRKD